MTPERQPSAPAIAATPRVFCKGCGYALVGLENNKCPECGRAFDPANRRTFATRPPRGWVWRWGKRMAAVVLLLLLSAGAGLGWLWRGWHAEQPTIARLRAPGQVVHVAPIGPQRLRWVLGERLGYLTDRVDEASIEHLGAAETEQLDLRSLTQIQKLLLYDCEFSNRNLNRLAGLVKLRQLTLFNRGIQKPDLAFLEKLPALTELTLEGEWVPSAGFEHIGRLWHLKSLSLSYTGLNDADLQHLGGLSSVEELHLVADPISDAGLEHLQGLKSLKRLWIDQRLDASPGMAKLEQAIPGLQVNGFRPPRP